MELGLLDMFGINEACKIALNNYEDIKLKLSPNYTKNSLQLASTNNIYVIGGLSDGNKKVVIDISDALTKNEINITLEDLNDNN